MTNNRVSYDSYQGILDSLGSLYDFNKLLSDRQNAGYSRHERLKEWVVLGRFYLDSCGNCFKYSEDLTALLKRNQVYNLPPVISSQNLGLIIKLYEAGSGKHLSTTASSQNDIPEGHAICPECLKGWGVDNCHDTVVEHRLEVVSLEDYIGDELSYLKKIWNMIHIETWRLQPDLSIRNNKYIDMTIVDSDLGRKYQWRVNERGWIKGYDEYIIQPGDESRMNIWTYRHHNCHVEYRLKEEQEYFQQTFEMAGYKNIEMAETENLYNHDDDNHPWFQVKADGILFTIGWRKRVIEICVNDPNVNFIDLFPNEKVTISANLIHAWSGKKCVEYLQTIRSTMLPKITKARKSWFLSRAFSVLAFIIVLLWTNIISEVQAYTIFKILLIAVLGGILFTLFKIVGRLIK